MARGAYAGLASVPQSVVETARGMGMTGGQILMRVEAGGLGSFVFLGLGQRALDLMLLGAVPTIFMALGVDFIFQLLLGVARRTP